MPLRNAENYIDTLASFERMIGKLECGEPQQAFLNIPYNYPRSPLRYPGGKYRATKAICSYIPLNEKILCSPFLGGGSVELACTTRMYVYGSDIFSPLVEFWQVLLDDKELLVRRVECYMSAFSKTMFYNLQKRYTHLEDRVERAAAFFVLNRSSFSGTTLSGGMSPGHPRFTPSSIERLRTFEVRNFEVARVDFRDAIANHQDAFLYLDPPYINGQELYGVKGDTHKDFDHIALAEILLNRDRWVLSYNDCPVVRQLYRNYPIISIDWVYGMSKNKQSNEILVLSQDLA